MTHAPLEHFHHAPQASRELGWEPYRDAAQICKDTWRWFNANPNGYLKPDKEFGAFKQVVKMLSFPLCGCSGWRIVVVFGVLNLREG